MTELKDLVEKYRYGEPTREPEKEWEGGGGEEGRGGSSRTAVQKPVREPGVEARPGTPETRKAAGCDFSDYEETRCRKNAKVGIGRKRMERGIR